ncbi:O-succinylbenzoic acid--CoA ligase [Croceivirga lutea]|uniref:AMP-binding protein n=1 Tax=Croceivirga lutea TaxID=1775167 RepID=UPI0016399213|nr:AMP-binding protein [Croceivirga lutea]GGG43791.1 O-succinylbenzoic acid--CoA ligase [Croceivirga lutea]
MLIHPKFKLNGQSYSKKELIAHATDLSLKDQAFEKSIGKFILDFLSESSTLSVFTSGSTGTPKKIILKKAQMVNSAMATASFFDLKEGHTALLCLPAEFIAGKMMIVRALVIGLALDYVAPNVYPLKNVERTYDFCAMVPMQIQNSLAELKKLKILIIGGAPLPNNLKEQLLDAPTRCFETYGMTETITHIAIKPIQVDYFEALPHVDIFLDERDCLVIDAPQIADDKIVTNDMVELIDRKRFKWLGRYDNIINSGGIKLIPEIIEAKLAKSFKERYFVYGTPDEQLGEKLVLVIESKLSVQEIQKKLAINAKLKRFEKPKTILTTPKFILTDSGKVDRHKTMASLIKN